MFSEVIAPRHVPEHGTGHKIGTKCSLPRALAGGALQDFGPARIYGAEIHRH